MRKRSWLTPLALSFGLVLAGSTSAYADPITPPNLIEIPDAPIDPLQILQTPLLGPTDFDPTPLIVTDTDLASAGVLAAPQVLIDDPNMLIVDDDHAQCPNATFTSINAAVLAAAPGATIRVCPGRYLESVQITKPGLVLQAPRQQGTATECKASVVPDPTKEAIVDYNAGLNGGNPAVGFDLEASGIVIEGFVVEPNPAIVTHDGVGIFGSRFFGGYQIRHNIVQNNTIGIYINNNGSAKASVRQNCVRNNQLGGAASGAGVYSDQGLQLAEIRDNYMTGNSNSVVIDTFLTTPAQIEVTHNEAVNDGAIAIFNSTQVTVTYNKVTNSAGSGVVFDAVTNSEISFNSLDTGNRNGINVRSSSTGNFVKSNKVVAFRLNGIRLGGSASANTVETNRSVNNGQAGMRAVEQANNNTIRNNHMRGNTPDCSDQTAGAGTAGTANFWINDTGQTADRVGICKMTGP